MRVLVGCESSGVVRDAFIKAGHVATSCDLLPTESEGPHIQGDIVELLTRGFEWDLIIIHPECTRLCVSGNHVYAKGKPKHAERLAAISWTYELWQLCLKAALRVCLENPQGVLHTNTDLPKPQYIQPYLFGHDASKKTGLTLHNLPQLTPTKYIEPRMVDGLPRWENQTDSGQNRLPPSADRWKIRSKTYQGIADAMAAQWG